MNALEGARPALGAGLRQWVRLACRKDRSAAEGNVVGVRTACLDAAGGSDGVALLVAGKGVAEFIDRKELIAVGVGLAAADGPPWQTGKLLPKVEGVCK